MSKMGQAQPTTRPSMLIPDDLNQRAFLAAAVKLAIEDLLPWSEVEFAARDGDNDFAAHDLPLHVRVRVIFASSVVQVLRGRRVRGEFLEPFLIIGVEARFIVVDEYGSSDVHGVDKHQAFLDAAFPKEIGRASC